MWLQFYQSLQPEKITDKFLWGRLEPLLGYLTDEQKSKVLEALHLAYDSHHGQVGAHACGVMLSCESIGVAAVRMLYIALKIVTGCKHPCPCCCCRLAAAKALVSAMLNAGAVGCRHARVGSHSSPIQWR